MENSQPDRVKKIALYVPSMRGGGAERVMLNLAKGLAAKKIHVDLVLAKAEGPYLDKAPEAVRIVDLKANRVLKSLPGLVAYLRRERPDALLSTMLHANIIALLAKKLAQVPVRVVVREALGLSEDLDRHSSLRKRMDIAFFRWCYSWADSIVAVSQGVADDYMRTLRVPPHRTHVVENAVVTPDLISDSLEEVSHPWFAAGEIPVILGVGRLNEQKDFPTLLKAFAMMRNRFPARLVILGEGEERPNLESLSRELGIDKEIQFLGFDINPFKYMAQAAVFVLSSRNEGMPGVLIQAMAVGTPVVATDCRSGPAEILENGKYGMLVPVGDMEAMAEAICETLAGRGNSRTDRNALKERASLFSLERSVNRYEVILFPQDSGG
ncbi:MAG: glycosyltransferase [Deltaproteobacteria bacterium]|nr:glycosyltransferase [Deltaproteobacteria bacterium]